MSKLKQIGLVLAGLLIAFSAGRFSAPAKVQEVERTVYRESGSTKKDQNVIETTKETKLPDGTIIKETRKEKETSTTRETIKEAERVNSKTIDNRPGYRVGVLYEPPITGLQEDSYGLIIERRLFSEVFIGVTANTQNRVGLSLTLGF